MGREPGASHHRLPGGHGCSLAEALGWQPLAGRGGARSALAPGIEQNLATVCVEFDFPESEAHTCDLLKGRIALICFDLNLQT